MPRKRKAPAFTAGIIRQIRKYTLRGLTEKETASAVGISKRVLMQWKRKYPFFADKLEHWKATAGEQVEYALFKRAIGYTKKQVKIFQYQGEPVVIEYDHYYPPDVKAAQLWLTNQNPEDWKVRQDSSLDLRTDEPLDFSFKVKEMPKKEKK